MDINRFKRVPILGILRCGADVAIEELIDSVASAGLETIEIAMNSGNAAGLIRRAVKASAGRVAVGAGTVLNTAILDDALSAGASFIVMPALIGDVAAQCSHRKIPFFPGAFSPQEVLEAWNAGASMVKVFPVAMFGPRYIRELKAPFDSIELLACGGITPENIKEYFDSGASAVAFGASVFRKDWLGQRDFNSINRSIADLIAHAK